MAPGENSDTPRGKLIAELEKLDKDPQVISSSIIISHPWGDISIQGDSVFVVTDNDQELAHRYARNLANKFWDLRHDFPLDLYSIQQAVKVGLETKEKGPVVICEMGDCILGGASGDIVTSLSYLIQRGIRGVVVAVIVDPESVNHSIKAGVGSVIKLKVGGKLYRDANPPLSFEGKVKFLGKDIKTYEEALNVGWETSMGNMAVIEGHGVEMVIVEYAGKVDDPSFLESLGINPREKKFIILKTSIPPLVSYKDVASKIILVDTPGWCYQDLYSVSYKKVPRPMFPLDPLMDWSAK
jgi:microcystin degradation protein MlrC